MPKQTTVEYMYKIIKSPVGNLKLVGNEDGLAAILWEKEQPKRVSVKLGTENKKLPIFAETEKQLTEYFAGKRKKFDLKLNFHGTDFQKKVWQALLHIPFGQTISYAELAKNLGSPKAVRAVGTANRKNPISIIAACHRVVSSTGTLAGYAGGFKAKALLLELEGSQKFEKEPHKDSKVLHKKRST